MKPWIQFKQFVLWGLRSMYLLPLIGKFYATINVVLNLKSNQNFQKKHPQEKFPPAYLMFDAYAHANYKNYRESGIEHAKLFSEIIDRYCLTNHAVVCEWGCGSARIIRYIKSKKISKLIGFDYNQKTIEWCKKTFKNIEFNLNSISPPLDLKKGSIDVLYCCSVFTHLSEKQHFLWINEIRRVLKPNGLFIGTFHSNELQKLLPKELSKINKEGLVVRGKIKEGSRMFIAFQNEDFIKNKLLGNFKNPQKINNQKTMQQSIWIAYK